MFTLSLYPDNGIGDICEGDQDDDGVLDEDDVCPNNKEIYRTDFR